MVGKTNGLNSKIINILPNEQIVGVKFKNDKHMYRYGLCFYKADLSKQASQPMAAMNS